MIRNGFRRRGNTDDDYFYRNEDTRRICNTRDVSEFIKTQQCNYVAHLIRADYTRMTKKLLFQEDKCSKRGRNTNILLIQVIGNLAIEKQTFVNKANIF